MSTKSARKIAAITTTVIFPPLLLWWIPWTEEPSIMVRLFDLDVPDVDPERPPLPTRHATDERENIYVPGVGWCKPKEDER